MPYPTADPVTLPVAASAGLADLLTGPERAVQVAGCGSGAAYLRDGAGSVVAVLAPAAPRLPCAVVAGDRVPDWPLGADGTVGLGRIAVGSWLLPVVRWWDPRPALAPTDPARLAGAAAQLLGLEREPASPVIADLPVAAVEGLAAARPDVPAAVLALAGRGPGLTPLGDDVLTGWLSTLTCLGHPDAVPVAADVVGVAAGRTTDLSMTLLRHAARGECVGALGALLRAVTTGRDVPRARIALAAVGHSSGTGLALGVRLGLDAMAGSRSPATVGAGSVPR